MYIRKQSICFLTVQINDELKSSNVRLHHLQNLCFVAATVRTLLSSYDIDKEIRDAKAYEKKHLGIKSLSP